MNAQHASNRYQAALLAFLLAAAAPAFTQSASRALTAAREAKSAEKLNRDGLPNLGKLSETLYRGGQPTQQGLAELKKLGIELVVNFRQEDEQQKNSEKKRVEALGMRYASIPWSGWDDPENRQVAEFLKLLRANSGKKIFVHCRRGAERTGVMVAAYRIAFENWTPEQALQEMEEFNFRGFFFRHLKKYVRNFPPQLESDQYLRALRPAP